MYSKAVKRNHEAQSAKKNKGVVFNYYALLHSMSELHYIWTCV